MSTRLYFDSTSRLAPPIHGWPAGWNNSGDARSIQRRWLVRHKGGPIHENDWDGGPGAGKQQRLAGQYALQLRDPITTGGTVTLAAPAREDSDAANAQLQLRVRAFAANGTDLLGTLYDGRADLLPSGTSPASDELTIAASQAGSTVKTLTGNLAPVALPAGAYIVVTVGTRQAYGGSIAGRSGHVTLGNPDTADAVAGAGAAACPWVEFSADLPIAGEATPPGEPAGLTVTDVTEEAVSVSWAAPAGGADGYQVRLDGGAWSEKLTDLTHTVSGLNPNTAYSVEVRAVRTASSRADAIPTSGPIELYDNSRNTYWTTGMSTAVGSFIAGYPAPTTITAYQLVSAANAGETPRAWTVSGSNDGGVSWTLLDTRADVPPQNDGEFYTYAITAPGAYSLYRFSFTANNGGNGTYVYQLNMIEGTTTTVASAPVGVVATTDLAAPREWIQHPFVSQTLLATAGLDVDLDQPAFQWHDHAGASWAIDALRSRSLMSWQITTGRPGPRDTVPPTAVTVTLAAWGAYADAGLPQLGQRFRLTLSPALTALGIAASDLPRFTGEVTDVDLDTSTRVLTVTGVGRIARKGRLPVDGTGWPVEAEGARVGRILAAIGAEPGTLDDGPTGLDLAAHAAAAPAAQLVEQVSASTTGQLVERRDGALDWHDADHRRDTAVLMNLDAGELLRGFRWSQRVGDLVNAATVKWSGGEVLVEDSASVAERERYPVSFDTLLTRAGIAQAIGGLIVGRYSRPVWLLPAVMLDVTRTLRALDAGAALALAHAAKVQLLGLPAGGPYTERTVYVEGVTETLTPRAWRLTLTVADERLSGAPIRWRDVPNGVRWTDARDGVRWLDVAKVQDPAELT